MEGFIPLAGQPRSATAMAARLAAIQILAGRESRKSRSTSENATKRLFDPIIDVTSEASPRLSAIKLALWAKKNMQPRKMPGSKAARLMFSPASNGNGKKANVMAQFDQKRERNVPAPVSRARLEKMAESA